MTMTRSTMPIMGATLLKEIPWDFIAPHDAQAQSNHGGQTLERLASRGGLAASEALDILEGRHWGSSAACVENEHYLIGKVREWRAAERAKA